MGSREETEELEEEGERGEPMELEPEEEEVLVLYAVWLREEDEFVVKGVDSG